MSNNILKLKRKFGKIREKSRGRSMVEMLGVLAIIGVLSIGGISGYTIAMRKYRANEILSAMQKYAMTIYATCQNELLDKQETVIDWSMAGGVIKPALNCSEPDQYLNVGLGSYPSGVTGKLYFIGWGCDTDNNDCSYGDSRGTFLSTNSGDIVRFYVQIESKELCQTLLNISGTAPNYQKAGWESKYIGMCEKLTDNSYLALLSFIMN